MGILTKNTHNHGHKTKRTEHVDVVLFVYCSAAPQKGIIISDVMYTCKHHLVRCGV